MSSNDDENYDSGECWITKFLIVKKTVPKGTKKGFALVRTADREGRCPDYECKANSHIVGFYLSRPEAEQAKKKATKGMNTNDDENYDSGQCWITWFGIFEDSVHFALNVFDSEEDDDEEEEEEEKEDSEENHDEEEEEEEKEDSEEDHDEEEEEEGGEATEK